MVDVTAIGREMPLGPRPATGDQRFMARCPDVRRLAFEKDWQQLPPAERS